MSDTIIARFHGALVEALRQRDPEHLSRPFTVAEIYQDLVPYGAYRDVLGVEMNGDYEHALLRLLAGESDYLELESEHALREIQEELESVNPNTGLYREFAAVDVRLNPAHIPDPADVEVHVPGAEEPGAEEESDGSGWPPASEGDPVSDRDYIQVVPLGAFAASGPLDPEMVDDEPASAEPVETASPMSAYATEAELNPEPEEPSVSSQAVEADNCRWCRETLPRRENLNFCPFCGTDVKLIPCIACGEAIEPEWRFCIACGARSPEE